MAKSKFFLSDLKSDRFSSTIEVRLLLLWNLDFGQLFTNPSIQQSIIVESVVGVAELQPGNHVLPIFTRDCGDCSHCHSEESNMCDLLSINTDRGGMIRDGESRFSINGKPIHH
ncbi:GroES-like protein [Raphanus sativus]|nr:GroES-like protein [Raphanus sativus]